MGIIISIITLVLSVGGAYLYGRWDDKRNAPKIRITQKKVQSKQNNAIEILDMLSVIFLLIGIVSTVILFFTVGISSTYSGTEFNAVGIISAILTLFTSLLVYYGCRVLIAIAEKV